ncbi:hypothetical protein [Sphingomonas sp. LM7]|uniref:hypothetical protein n=1 Tax=Sphingomonas sp. LM7 TaxID=1938607 RepID=UPI000983C171|nr:hypothetical protein [Sphingomonas sp. LM7]AQR74718.1 hypothetical protein BXU08_14615 [Sphingomonas sp. LM7]
MPATILATREALIAAGARSRATMLEWREGSAYRAAGAAFADCGDSPEHAADCAERLLADPDWAGALLAPLVRALAADPLFEPALKFHRDALRVGAVLFDCPTASIAASVTGAAAMATLPPPATIVFTGRLAVTRTIRAGGASLRRWIAAPMHAQFGSTGAGRCTPDDVRPLHDDAVHRTDGRTQAQLIVDAADDVVTLVATIRSGAAPLMREYDIATGVLLRVADADDRPSRKGMLLHFLRVAGRADAQDRFEAETRTDDFHLRWTAMREWLALDAARAMPRLAEMAAADPSDEVRRAAVRMLPVVQGRLADARCPA